MYNNIMLASPNKVKQYATVGLNLDDSVLGNCIRLAQVHVKEVVTKDVFERVQELVNNKIQASGSSIDDNENIAYKTLLDECIVPAIAYGAAVEAATINELKIRNAGTVKNSDTNVMTVTRDEYDHLASYYRTYLNDAFNRIADFLCENKAAFKELPDGYCTCSSKPRYANCNLWLGPSKR